MPSTYAHYRLGQEVLKNLPAKEKRLIEQHKELFDIGLHGPDILFYYKPYTLAGSTSRATTCTRKAQGSFLKKRQTSLST